MLWTNLISAGLAITALGGVGCGIGILFAGFLVAFSQAPVLEKQLFNYSLIAFALVEAMGLFTLMITFLLLYSTIISGSIIDFPVEFNIKHS
jgi:F-type H+-transporting ATPase subunit c